MNESKSTLTRLKNRYKKSNTIIDSTSPHIHAHNIS